jgi:hypothetical protein
MSSNIKKKIKNELNRKYIAKDFDDLKLDLLKYAKIYYPNTMQDFSEASLGGLLVDLAAYVGDTMSFYTDHQFRELDPTLAVEAGNIQKMAQNVGIRISGAAPAVAEVDFYVRVPAVEEEGILVPQVSALPVIKEGTVLTSKTGVHFFLIEDINYNLRDSLDQLVAKKIKIKTRNNKEYFVLVRKGTCVSGQITTQRFTLNNSHVPFRTLTLSNGDVSTILRVNDGDGNEYYEVDSLSQDTVFRSFPNNNATEDGVESNLSIIPAPYRFVTRTNISTRQTSLKFGAGKASAITDDGVPDPSDLALPLYGKKTMSRFSLDPAAMLDTKTLGISPKGTTMAITYRYGGGASHNVSPKSINGVKTLSISFNDSLAGSVASEVRSSVEVVNEQPAAGGSNRPSIEEIRRLIPLARNLQSRIVTREDLLARLYLLPNEYGRIFRAGIVANPDNPLASILYVISRDSNNRLTPAPDVLKKNISKYLNEFRMISDAIDILDVAVLNFRVNISIATAPGVNKLEVTKMVLDKVKKHFKLTKMQVGQPIIESELVNVIINTPGVLSLIELRLTSLSGTVSGKSYSEQETNFDSIKANGIYFPQAGGIFELRYPNSDVFITVR